MRHAPTIEYVRRLSDTDPSTMADAITEACEAIGKAAESQQVMVYGPAVSFAGNHLVLRWSSDFPSLAKDVLRKLLPSDSRKPASRFHAVDTSPEAVARGYAECIDTPPPAAPANYALPEFSEPVVAGLSKQALQTATTPQLQNLQSTLSSSTEVHATETMTGDYIPPANAEPLPVLAPGESLNEPVAFADPGPHGSEYVTPTEEAAYVSDREAAEVRSTVATSDGTALSRNMPVKVAIDGEEPASGIVQAGPRGMLVVKGVVRVKLDDGQTVFAKPEALTASKE